MLGQLPFRAGRLFLIGEPLQVAAEADAALQVHQGAGLGVRPVQVAARLGFGQLGGLRDQRGPMSRLDGRVLTREFVRLGSDLVGQGIVREPGNFREPGTDLARSQCEPLGSRHIADCIPQR